MPNMILTSTDSTQLYKVLRQINHPSQISTYKNFTRLVTSTPASQLNDLPENWKVNYANKPTRTAIMVSKENHCLNSLLQEWQAENMPIYPVAIISNHKDLECIAVQYDVPFYHIPVIKTNKPDAERQLLEITQELDVELLVLAKYMQILSDNLCSTLGKWNIPAINIHHSFLPAFKGARPYKQAYDRGVKMIGATAHYVTPDLDEGPIITQESQDVNHTHTPDDLARIGRHTETKALNKAVQWHTEHRIFLTDHRTIIL